MVVDMYTTIVLRERERERGVGREGEGGGGRGRERDCVNTRCTLYILSKFAVNYKFSYLPDGHSCWLRLHGDARNS